MDFEKAKLEIIWKGEELGFGITESGKDIDYNELTRDEQLLILDTLMSVRDFYLKFLKEE